MKGLELIVFQNVREIDWTQLAPMPTIVLCALEPVPEQEVINGLVEQLVGLGCNYFMLGGQNPESIEDLVDYYLEDHEHFEITTSSHKDESPAELAEFISSARAWSNPPSRCIMIVENDSLDCESLANELRQTA